ncbi:MAG TPA: transposase [Gemmatimonadaceae bacterium]|nr:transposase [Gemmatimonadaceae bacterium]
MSRPLRLQFPGALYHITSRGDGREPIYLDDSDRGEFLAIVALVCERYHWSCHSYCLMTNHYHLLIETQAATLSRGMRQLNGVYTQRFNRAHARVGHVYQGRYSAVLVQRERHLLEVLRYIVLNPVRAGMVSAASEWSWSSYRAAIGLVPSPPWLLTDGLAAIFGSGAEGRREFTRFVDDGVGVPSCWRNLKGQIYLGDSTFISDAQACIAADASGLSEVPEVQKHRRHASSERWEEHYSVYRNMADRDRAIVDAFMSGGGTMRAIGEHFGIHYSRVSRIVSNAETARARGKT